MILYLVVLVLFLIFIIKWLKHYPSSKSPPGPFALPLLGNLLSLGNRPFVNIAEYMNKRKYKIMSLKFGSCPVVVIKDPALLHEACVTKWKNFSSRAVTNSMKLALYFPEGGCDLTFANGETWKRYRRILATSLTKTKIHTQRAHLDTELVEFNNQVMCLAKQTSEIDFSFFTKRYALNVIQRLCFGSQLPYNDAEANERSAKLIRQIEVVSALFGPIEYISDYLPILEPLDYNRKLRMRREMNTLAALIEEEISEHRAKLDPNQPKDILDNILVESQRDPDSNFFGELDIMLLCVDMYVAGTDTSSTTLDWFLYLLAIYPQYQDQLFSEISKAVGTTDFPKFSEMDKTPLLNATLKETQRIRPVVPLSVPRSNDEDDYIGGYFIPKNTMVIWNVWAYNYDPDIWTSPEKFYPERFMEPSPELHNFGSGPRMCVGASLAEEVVYQACAMLCQRYSWQLVSPQTKDLDLGVVTLVLHPNQHKLKFFAR